MVEQRRVVWWRVTAEAGEVGVHVGHDDAGARVNGGKFQEVAGGRGRRCGDGAPISDEGYAVRDRAAVADEDPGAGEV
jgi:hypothetical protein